MTPHLARKRRDEPARTTTFAPDEIARERGRLGIPDEGTPQRNWIRYQLQQRGWSQARLARSVEASESSVSVIFTGGRTAGEKADRVRALTAEVLSIPEAVLFPQAAHDHARREEAARRREAEERHLRKAALMRRK